LAKSGHSVNRTIDVGVGCDVERIGHHVDAVEHDGLVRQ
jgi:hypothetical protein